MVGPAHFPSERLGFYSFEASVPIFVQVLKNLTPNSTPHREEIRIVGAGGIDGGFGVLLLCIVFSMYFGCLMGEGKFVLFFKRCPLLSYRD